jgi:hypothetical protein
MSNSSLGDLFGTPTTAMSCFAGMSSMSPDIVHPNFEAWIPVPTIVGFKVLKENPTIDLLDRLAKTLGVHLSEFFLQPPKGAMAPRPLPKGRKPACPNRKKA